MRQCYILCYCLGRSKDMYVLYVVWSVYLYVLLSANQQTDTVHSILINQTKLP